MTRAISRSTSRGSLARESRWSERAFADSDSDDVEDGCSRAFTRIAACGSFTKSLTREPSQW
jgi:hypothetical protein